MIELQSHSTVSDGQLAPGDVVEAAHAAGVTTLALTDHDAVNGVPEALVAAERVGLQLVPAIEVSSVHRDADDLHVCGYGIDLEAIAPLCERAQAERIERAGQICARLREHGVEVQLADAVAEAGGAASVGRPHIAKAAGARNMNAFFAEYLVPGAKAFVPRSWPTTAEAVEIIRAAKGTAVFAHPFWDFDDPDRVDALLDDVDFDGVEVFYPSHTRRQTEFLVQRCRERGLATTASSDFHGPTHKTFSRFGAYQTFGLGEPELPLA
ncbi:MAG: PHP domain-containing protein [Solirubrobacterales bacterium]